MKTRNDILSYLTANKTMLLKKYSLASIGIFGSVARNENKENSDLDILILFNENTSNIISKKAALKNQLSTELNIRVDICSEKYIKPFFKENILKEAIYV